MNDKEVRIGFISQKLKDEYKSLATGRYEEKQLYKNITKAFGNLKKDISTGRRIPEKYWPQYYAKHDVSNLWKYDLSDGWRLIYTTETDQLFIVAIVLEWFDHKGYEKRFRYKVK